MTELSETDSGAVVPGQAPCLHRPWFPSGRMAGRRACDGACAHHARPYVLAATILGSAMAFIDGTVVHIALPQMQVSLGADFGQLQWIINAYTLLLGCLILVGGSLGDRLGRRRVFAAGIILFAFASGLCGLAQSAPALIAARALQGLGAALLIPQSLAILAAAFPRTERGRAIGIWAGCAALTTAAGPVLGGFFIDVLSWRAAFWVNLPIAVVTLVLVARFVPESRDQDGGRPLDLAGAGLIVLGLGLLTVALTRTAEHGLTDPVVLGLAAIGMVVIMAFLYVESRVAAPMMPPNLFRRPGFAGANLITVLLYAALSAVLLLLPFNLIQVQGYSGFAAGAALLPFGILMGLLSSAAGRWADRVGPKLPLVLGSVLVAVACAGFVLTGLTGSYWLAVFPSVLLLAAGMTLAVTPLTTAVMNAVPEREAGLASGVNNAASRLAGLAAVALVGAATTAWFAAALAHGLAPLTLPAPIADGLLSGANHLAALRPPVALAPELAGSVQGVIDTAFMEAYRFGVGIAGVCAMLAALCALAWVPGRRRVEPAAAAA